MASLTLLLDDVHCCKYRKGQHGSYDVPQGERGKCNILCCAKEQTKKKSTPLPWLKVLVVSLVLFGNNFGSLMIFPFLPFMIQDFFPSLHRSELGSRAGYLGSSYYIGSFFGSLMVSSSAGTHILLHYVWPTYISMCKHLCMYVYICVCMHMCVQCVCVQYVFPHFLLFVWNFSFPKLWAQVCRLHIAGCTGVIVGYFWDISGRSPMQGLNNDQWLICHCFLCLKFFANKCMTFV
jgi:MFS family permease